MNTLVKGDILICKQWKGRTFTEGKHYVVMGCRNGLCILNNFNHESFIKPKRFKNGIYYYFGDDSAYFVKASKLHKVLK